MKKLLATLLTMGMVFSCSTVAFAANETVLTTTVPGATYTLNIPANQEIPFGATSTNIGNVTVTNSSGFAMGKDLQVTVEFQDFSCNDTNTTIPYSLHHRSSDEKDLVVYKSGSSLMFPGQRDGTVTKNTRRTVQDSFGETYEEYSILRAVFQSEDWGKALAGEYSSTITFTAEVVSSQS